MHTNSKMKQHHNYLSFQVFMFWFPSFSDEGPPKCKSSPWPWTSTCVNFNAILEIGSYHTHAYLSSIQFILSNMDYNNSWSLELILVSIYLKNVAFRLHTMLRLLCGMTERYIYIQWFPNPCNLYSYCVQNLRNMGRSNVSVRKNHLPNGQNKGLLLWYTNDACVDLVP